MPGPFVRRHDGFMLATRVVQVTRGTTRDRHVEPLPRREHPQRARDRQPTAPYRHDRGVASETILDRSELADLAAAVSRTIRFAPFTHFPRVSVADDFRSEFTVRGSPFRHVEVVVDGVATPWLQHTAYGRGATGSLTMLTGQVLEEATLRVGAYPRRFGDRLGAQLDMRLREGSASNSSCAERSAASTRLLSAKGPLGTSGTARGSWLVAARQSYLEWPAERTESTRAAFGFSDGFAKVVYDVRPNQQVGFSVLGGMSNVDGEETPVRASLVTARIGRLSRIFRWRSTFGSSVVLTQRAYVVRHRFLNKDQRVRTRTAATNEEVVVSRRHRPSDCSAGCSKLGLKSDGPRRDRIRVWRRSSGFARQARLCAASSWQRSGYAHFAWAVDAAITLSPGLRVTDSTLLPQPPMTPLDPRRMGLPNRLDARTLRRAFHINYLSSTMSWRPGIDRTFGPSVRRTSMSPSSSAWAESVSWQATFSLARTPTSCANRTSTPGSLATSSSIAPIRAAMQQLAWIVPRDRAAGGSAKRDRTLGMGGDSYGKTRHTDPDRHETFWADFDQRHAFNVFGVYRFSNRPSVGTTFRAGTNFPIPAYLSRARRRPLRRRLTAIEVRLPAYARLDVRADRGFESFGRRLTIFARSERHEPRQPRPGHGSVRPSTGEAIGFTDTLFPRRVSAGILIEF